MPKSRLLYPKARVTLTLLRNMPSGRRSCGDAQRWFKRRFPKGTHLEIAWEEVYKTHPFWRDWFRVNLLSLHEDSQLSVDWATLRGDWNTMVLAALAKKLLRLQKRRKRANR